MLVLVLLIAAVWLYRSPYNASDLEVSPDSVEYAVGALQFVDTGRYEILVQGRPLPPRYPPWFPVALLAPAYFLLGDEPGNGIVPVTCFAIVGVGLAWRIGRRIAAAAGGALAALAVIAIPAYATWGTRVMTDVPCTTLMLAACLVYLRLRSKPAGPMLFAAAGFIVGLATVFRPVYAAMALPFVLAVLRAPAKRIRSLALLVLPMGVAAGASVVYNARTFGSATRNGYHFWTAVPSDYPGLAFSFANVPLNLWVLSDIGFPVFVGIAIVAWLILRKRDPAALVAARRPLVDVLTFFTLTAVPIVLFHLLYFFRSDRFYLPALVAAAVIAGALVGLLVDKRRADLLNLLLPGILLLALGWRLTVADPMPHRRIAADTVRKHTPENAIIISFIEPVYMDRMVAWGSDRKILPLTRNVEYASKLLVPKRIEKPDPAPRDWLDHRAAGLIKAGAQEAVPFVASERIPELVAEAKRGTPIFLEVTGLSGAGARKVISELEASFSVVQRAQNLFELRTLSANDAAMPLSLTERKAQLCESGTGASSTSAKSAAASWPCTTYDSRLQTLYLRIT